MWFDDIRQCTMLKDYHHHHHHYGEIKRSAEDRVA